MTDRPKLRRDVRPSKLKVRQVRTAHTPPTDKGPRSRGGLFVCSASPAVGGRRK